MDWERSIIVAGMIAAVIAFFIGPTLFAWGVYLGSRGRAGRRARRNREAPHGWGYKLWK